MLVQEYPLFAPIHYSQGPLRNAQFDRFQHIIVMTRAAYAFDFPILEKFPGTNK